MGDDVLYFLNIYSNTNGEDVKLTFYDATYQQLLPTDASFGFVENASMGYPSVPHEVTAGHFIISFDEQLAHIDVINPLWTGSEDVSIIAADVGTMHNYSTQTTFTLTVEPDYSPVVSQIPSQTTQQGSGFTNFDLDDYLSELDGDNIIWSASQSDYFDIDISSENVATVSPLVSQWMGQEEIFFTATDDTDNGFSGTNSAVFTVLTYDNPPSIANFPNQEITLGESFSPIVLADNLVELDGDAVEWSFGFVAPETPEEVLNWNINPADYELSMTVTATVISRDVPALGSNHILGAFYQNQCRGIVTDAMELNGQWLYFLTVYSNSPGEDIHFKFFDAEFSQTYPISGHLAFQTNASHGVPLNPFIMQAGHFILDFDSQTHGYIEQVDIGWTGSIDILVIAQDVGTLHNYADTATVSITVHNDQPVLSQISSITVNEDTQVPSINLYDKVADVGTPDYNINWEITGTGALSYSLSNGQLSFAPEAHYFGNHTITITTTDDDDTNPLSDSQSFNLNILPVNDAPVISIIDNQTMDEDTQLSLALDISDVDNEDLTISIQSSTPQVETNLTGAMLNITPSANYFGSTYIVVSVSDGEFSVQIMFMVTINPITDYGCTNETACNYDPIADTEDGSCELAETHFDCDGICIEELDCNGVCGGDNFSSCIQDCAGEWVGIAYEDYCNVCDDDTINDCGDTSQDGLINVSDIILVVDYILGNAEFTDQQFANSNVFEDDYINVADITVMVYFILENGY